VCAIIYESVCAKAKPSLYELRVAKKSAKRAPNLQDLLCLTVFIYIIYLLTILLRFRLPGLKSIYLLREHHTKSIAERSYSLLRGRDFSIQISLPGVIPIGLLSESHSIVPHLTCKVPQTILQMNNFINLELQARNQTPSKAVSERQD
jgi:hypothetical protein